MKILHLISSGGMYGAEAMLLNLASAQQRAGCRPVIAAFRNTPPHLEVADAARAGGVPVEIVPCDGRVDWNTVRSIRGLLRKHDVEVLHTHGWKSDIYAYLAARTTSVPVLATCHLWTRKTFAVRIYEFLDSLFLRRLPRVVAVSETIASRLQSAGIPKARVVTINNGTDFFAGSAAPTLRHEIAGANVRIIGTVGRLNKQKGIEYFLQAARGVADRHPGTIFAVVGGGPERPQLEALTRELGLQNCVFLVGERNDMPGVYASLDLFVLASIDEGMPMTILEALAAAKPVIATRVGAVGKLVLHGRTGLLVEARDVAALREAMLQLIEQPSLAQELAQAGSAHVRESFSADRMAHEYLEIYRKLAPARPNRSAASFQEA